MAADTRSRMIDAAVDALQRRGLAGMSFTEVLEASGAARGAIYHHFPGGKTELVTEAAHRNGATVRECLAALPGDTPAAVVDAFLALIRPVVAASAEGGGCAIAAITVEPEGDSLRPVAEEVFASWTAALAERLTAARLPPTTARDLATTLLSLLEGAHVLCRAAGTLDPFDQCARTITALVAAQPIR